VTPPALILSYRDLSIGSSLSSTAPALPFLSPTTEGYLGIDLSFAASLLAPD